MAQIAGAEVAIVGLERDTTRLAVASRYGVTTIVGNPTEWAMASDGLGVEGVVDAAGVSATLKTRARHCSSWRLDYESRMGA